MHLRAALLALWRLAEVTNGSPITAVHPTENSLRRFGSRFSSCDFIAARHSSPKSPPSSLHPPLPTLTFSSSFHHLFYSPSASSIDFPSPQPVKCPEAVKPPPKEVPRLSKAPQADTGEIRGVTEDDEGDGEADRNITLSSPPKERTSRWELRHQSLPTPETPLPE